MELDLKKLDEDIRRFDEELEELKRERVAKGLPAERPPSFVSLKLTHELFERVCPLRNAIIKYASLIGTAGRVLPLDVKKLRDKYTQDLTLLNESVGVFSSLTGHAMIDSLNKIEEAINSDETEVFDLVRGLYVNISLFMDRPAIYDLVFDNVAEVIDDEEQAIAHYEKIKHLI
ncbi:hypothetical protein [Bacillus sp. AFS041924]|uniref:hypothetical protein n=1 Tax=Bacillus sp. AFS041924 TaxID=2033503 RepID=UPI000BFBA883|nr:hypothetical protein [Bacillus sp. AFS041924]PGS55095.1 hypothetical protein COC46_04005 [Bacillus sp. AFS041924]